LSEAIEIMSPERKLEELVMVSEKEAAFICEAEELLELALECDTWGGARRFVRANT
jgi:hypothetical protein